MDISTRASESTPSDHLNDIITKTSQEIPANIITRMTKSKIKMMTSGRSNEVETSTGKWLVQKRKSSKSIDESTATTSKEKEKKRIGDRKYVKGVTKIKEAKRKRNSGDNRATIKKQKTVKEQKTVKDILKELPSINTRSTPNLMTDVVSSLTSEQKDWVKRMGFKAFLKINIKSIPLKLCHFVLEHYDEGTNNILIKGKRIKITKEKIHKVFGLPKTGKSLFDLDMVSEDHQVFDGWMKELEGGKANATNYKKIIQKSEQVDMNFKLGFIALFVNTFVESIPMGTNNLVPVRALVEVDDISKIDLFAYLLYCVKNSKGRWRPDNPKCYYRGPMLLLFAFQNIRSEPAISSTTVKHDITQPLSAIHTIFAIHSVILQGTAIVVPTVTIDHSAIHTFSVVPIDHIDLRSRSTNLRCSGHCCSRLFFRPFSSSFLDTYQPTEKSASSLTVAATTATDLVMKIRRSYIRGGELG
ncbi:unnamed protein product [Lactuca virosa]|uniref:Uncharacterized protein n=1 Tax=Lactuca virosa TaxID=75947 RepID=A0AAU9MK68_9ASTR|nr:unnamed protein product [Lactuca virosa]